MPHYDWQQPPTRPVSKHRPTACVTVQYCTCFLIFQITTGFDSCNSPVLTNYNTYAGSITHPLWRNNAAFAARIGQITHAAAKSASGRRPATQRRTYNSATELRNNLALGGQRRRRRCRYHVPRIQRSNSNGRSRRTVEMRCAQRDQNASTHEEWTSCTTHSRIPATAITPFHWSTPRLATRESVGNDSMSHSAYALSLCFPNTNAVRVFAVGAPSAPALVTGKAIIWYIHIIANRWETNEIFRSNRNCRDSTCFRLQCIVCAVFVYVQIIRVAALAAVLFQRLLNILHIVYRLICWAGEKQLGRMSLVPGSQLRVQTRYR